MAWAGSCPRLWEPGRDRTLPPPPHGWTTRFSPVFSKAERSMGAVGRFFNCGQQCLGVKRMYVFESVYDAFVEQMVSKVKKLTIGVPVEFFAEGLDPEVDQAVRAAIEEMKELGAQVKEIRLPRTDAAVAVYYVLATAEASSNLARYDGVKFGLRAKETKRAGAAARLQVVRAIRRE